MVIMSVIFTNRESTPILVHGVCSVAYCTVFVSIQDTDKICKGDPVLSTGHGLRGETSQENQLLITSRSNKRLNISKGDDRDKTGSGHRNSRSSETFLPSPKTDARGRCVRATERDMACRLFSLHLREATLAKSQKKPTAPPANEISGMSQIPAASF